MSHNIDISHSNEVTIPTSSSTLQPCLSTERCVNTINHSSGDHDIRTSDESVCPKYFVTPWMNSSVVPDRCIRNLGEPQRPVESDSINVCDTSCSRNSIESDRESQSSDIEANRDKYDISKIIPQSKEKDWFETIETVDVKNSHLINIYRPIGVTTIGSGSTMHDIRGLDKAVCPKFVVSPWLQSTAVPDRANDLC